MSVAKQQRIERPGRSPVVPVALTSLVLILAAAVWALVQEPAPLQEQRLPDGSLLRLEAVTTGIRHRFVCGRRWQRLLATLLPERMAGTLRGFVHERRGSGPGEIDFWTVWRPT